MTKHSKNRTAAPVFSYEERQKTLYGSKKARLGRDSLRNFDACALCLQTARDARMCDEGHLFCQECAVTSLLSQKKEIKRQQALLDKMKVEEEQERLLARQHARQRVLEDFERLQSGAGPSKRVAGPSGNALASPSALLSSSTTVPSSSLIAAETKDSVASEGGRGVKRKFELDDGTVSRLADEQERKALDLIEREQAEKRKAKLPNFWLPSLTPEAAPTKLSDVKLQTLCHAGAPVHPISLKSLTIVNFHRVDDSSSEAQYICPCCRKTLSNNIASFVLKPCGHVLCVTCIDTLVKKTSPMQCAHCDAKLSPEKKKPIVALKREGTGYAAGGQAEAKRSDLAFQA